MQSGGVRGVSGYVRIHRALCGHPAFRNDAEAMAFAWMVAKAAWKPCRVRYKERGICLRRGQLAVSVRDLAIAMDRDKAWVERLLKRLRAETMIEVAHETGVNVITICNYAEYQGEQDKRKTADETLGETQARQTRDTEQGMEEREEDNITPQPPGGGRRGKTNLPADWVLPAVSALPPKSRACAEQWTPASYETEGEGFVLYWRSCGRMMKDWDGTWANRVIARHEAVMRAQKFGNAPPAGPAKPKGPLTDEELRSAIRYHRDNDNPAKADELEAELKGRAA
jgi:hypothetical protein